MARFGVDLPDIQLTGELYQQQGVVDKSGAMMIDAISDQIVPVATQVQNYNLKKDLKQIDEEMEAGLEADIDDDFNNPAVKGFQAELDRLNRARNKISESQYEARKNAALKARINQTPGLADALSRTKARYDSLNEYSVLGQAFAAQASAQDQWEDLVGFGVNKLGLPPTWVNDPEMVKYAEVRSRQHMEAMAAGDMKAQIDLISAQIGVDDKLLEQQRRLTGQQVNAQLAGRFMDTVTQGLNITLGSGEDSVTVNAMDAVAVGALSVEQRIGLARTLKAEFLAEQTQLTAQVNSGLLDPKDVSGHLDNLKSMYNTMIGFTNLEDEAALITQEDTVASRGNLATGRALESQRMQVEGMELRYKALDIGYNMEMLDRTRALEIQSKELEVVNQLVVAGATGAALQNPAILDWKVKNTLGLVDPRSANAQIFLEKLAKGEYGNERDYAVQGGDFAKWQQHVLDETGIYRRLRVDLATPANAAIIAKDAAMKISQVERAAKDQVRPLTMDEVSDVMNIFASNNYGKIVSQYSEQFGDVGTQMEQVVAPVIARDFVTKATKLYAQQGVNNVPLLSIKDGKFAIGNRPVSGAMVQTDSPEARIVKGLNNTAQAIANTQNIPLEEANKKVLSMIPMDRMINLFERNIQGQSVSTSVFPEAQGDVQAEVKTAIDNLYGDGAYRNHIIEEHTREGYTEYGPVSGGTLFIHQNGDKVVIGD